MTTTADPKLGQERRKTVVPRWHAALAGVLAAVAALVAAELVAAFVEAAQSPVTSIGTAVINLAPPALRDFAVELFGTADKSVLIGGVLVVLAVVAAVTGVLAVRRFWLGAAGVVLLGFVGLAAALADANATSAAAPLPALTAMVAGVACLRLLVGALLRDADTGDGDGTDRRAFVRAAAAVVGSALVGGTIARWLTARSNAAAAVAAAGLPSVDQPLPPLPESAALSIRGLAPLVTPNADFYRIDTALGTPTVPTEQWRLTIKGMVDNPMKLTFDQLLDYELIEADITLACVSNEIGGYLVGNARWLGVRLADVLADARVQPGADQLVGRSTDGFTTGSPLATVLDGRNSIIAIGMNGEPLPAAHGFPARIVVPGLYGYVSATKWLAELELTTFDAFDAYWVPRGWAAKAPIKTQSRIDVPRRGATVAAGRVPVAGVAWAPNRGIAGVEVQIDDGAWQQARLSEVVSKDSWRQWLYEWQATEGEHQIRVRATDDTGETQTERLASPRPDGATGWHTIPVSVTAT
jgi:DMSO/TMAO reductase YedYZ molybdopterin-dependent catalytic subunit